MALVTLLGYLNWVRAAHSYWKSNTLAIETPLQMDTQKIYEDKKNQQAERIWWQIF